MDRKTLQTLLAQLPKAIDYSYDRGRYALMLLEWAVEREPQRVRQLRRTPLGAFLDKPQARPVLARAHDGVLRKELFAALEPPGLDYVLTFGEYEGTGPDDQVSRAGVNLVVQVNFDHVHDARLAALELDEEIEEFNQDGHPVHDTRTTLAWARVDLDVERREALVEEIQSDWVRAARDARAEAWELLDPTIKVDDKTRYTAAAMIHYVDRILAPHARVWSELTLAATLWVLRTHLDVADVWVHTHESNLAYKDMSDWPPPKSLYTKLPKRFGFQRTDRAPAFLAERESATGQQPFHKVRLS